MTNENTLKAGDTVEIDTSEIHGKIKDVRGVNGAREYLVAKPLSGTHVSRPTVYDSPDQGEWYAEDRLKLAPYLSLP